jgi:hypothetical protein
MGDRGIAHPIHVLFEARATPGALSAGPGGRTRAGLDLARIRGRLHAASTAPVPTALPRRPGSGVDNRERVGVDNRERVDVAIAPRSSMPWTL